jgi:hypothetical protein
MSKHLSRKQRWVQRGSTEYSSRMGKVIYRETAWYALLDYKVQVPPSEPRDLAGWDARHLRLGPFKRPRNAMVALEREVTFLRNRFGADLLVEDEV